jgi:membrane protease subunit (stomatin/prohibitin family)
MIVANVKSHLAQAIKDRRINIVEVDGHLASISKALQAVINEELAESGMEIPSFYITAIDLPDPNVSENYKILLQSYISQGNVAANVTAPAAVAAPATVYITRWTCNICGTRDNANHYCGNCGNRGAFLWNCSRCGAQDVRTAFCAQCGIRSPNN